MANPYNAYSSTLKDSIVQVKDYAHASRIFVDDNFRLFPKQNFLFHVVFNINQAALKDQTLTQKYRNEVSMLVKSAALPSFNLKTETVNQYNRKKIIQLTTEYQPIQIKFRDDSANVVNRLWQAYYGYYYADASSANQPGAFARNAMNRAASFAYGLDNKSQTQFFNHITIYQLSRHEYTGFKLINPVITSWNHELMDYSNPGHHENSATIQYEAVAYSSGSIDDGIPEGFGQEHYDTTPSPLSLPQGATNLSRAGNTAVDPNTARTTSAETLNNVVKQVNNYQNSQSLSNTGVSGLSANIGRTSVSGVSGIQGTAFPVPKSQGTTTPATSIKIIR